MGKNGNFCLVGMSRIWQQPASLYTQQSARYEVTPHQISPPTLHMAPASGTERSRVLVIGGTGFIGRHIVAASAREGHPTFVLARDAAPADPAKAALLQEFRDAGVTLIKVSSPSRLLILHPFPLFMPVPQ